MGNGDLLNWVHLLAMAAYFGAQFAVIYMLLPAAEQAGNEQGRRAALIAGFRFYNPFSIAMLGIVVVGGAMRLTDLKAELKFNYFSRVWPTLSLKLALAFLVIFLQTYVTFGLAFRIGRQEEIAAHGDGDPFTVEQVNSILARIRSVVWVTIVLTAAIVFVSLRLVERAAAGPAAASLNSAPLSERVSKAANNPQMPSRLPQAVAGQTEGIR